MCIELGGPENMTDHDGADDAHDRTNRRADKSFQRRRIQSR
jgi:hypothetical protein